MRLSSQTSASPGHFPRPSEGKGRGTFYILPVNEKASSHLTLQPFPTYPSLAVGREAERRAVWDWISRYSHDMLLIAEIKTRDERHNISKKRGNGQLRREVWQDDSGRVTHYKLAYINHLIHPNDNGRVLASMTNMVSITGI